MTHDLALSFGCLVAAVIIPVVLIVIARAQRQLFSADAMFGLAQSGPLPKGCVPRRTLDGYPGDGLSHILPIGVTSVLPTLTFPAAVLQASAVSRTHIPRALSVPSALSISSAVVAELDGAATRCSAFPPSKVLILGMLDANGNPIPRAPEQLSVKIFRTFPGYDTQGNPVLRGCASETHRYPGQSGPRLCRITLARKRSCTDMSGICAPSSTFAAQMS